MDAKTPFRFAVCSIAVASVSCTDVLLYIHDTAIGNAADAGDGNAGTSGATSGGGGSGAPSGDGGPEGVVSSGSSSAGNSGSPGDAGTAGVAALVFSPYKDTSINMNWNTNVISTNVSSTATTFVLDLKKNGGKTVTLAFATGECGSESWAGIKGPVMASANVSLLTQAGVNYILSTGGAAGTFTCASDSGFSTFVDRWTSAQLVGVDFDIEGGLSQAAVGDIVRRIQSAHGNYPNLRFSLTLATLAVSEPGSTTAKSLGAAATDSFNVYGDWSLQAIASTFGAAWPSYLTIDLLTMDYGSPGPGNCVVSGGTCQMGQSAIQAAYNLHDKWGVPYANIELTPMLGGNDIMGEYFVLDDADAITRFAISQGLAGIHYWSYDRDTDCAKGSASPTCNSMGIGYAGAYGYLKRFLAGGLR